MIMFKTYQQAASNYSQFSSLLLLTDLSKQCEGFSLILFIVVITGEEVFIV